MMIWDLLLLFSSALLAGLMVFLVPKVSTINFKLTLVFAGAYLFSITIIHLLPEIFTASEDPSFIGFIILIGFFMQIVLAQFTSGVEHGHMRTHTTEQHAGNFSAATLLIALCFHAFMEGTLLAHPSSHIHQHDTQGLLLGIILHKMPAAFALMSVLRSRYSSYKKPVIYLLLFALASPLGSLVSTQFHDASLITTDVFLLIYALVCGNFLHISTTIFFESSPEHRFHFKRLAVSLAGALLAVVAEFFI